MIVFFVLGRIIEFLYLFFVPGFVWTFAFFPRKDLDWIERTVFSVALSIGLVTLTVFWLNWLFEVKISQLNVCLVAAGLTIIAFGWVVARDRDFRSRLWDRLRHPLGSESKKSEPN